MASSFGPFRDMSLLVLLPNSGAATPVKVAEARPRIQLVERGTTDTQHKLAATSHPGPEDFIFTRVCISETLTTSVR